MAQLVEATFDAEIVEPVLTVSGTAGHGTEHFITVEGQRLDEGISVKFDPVVSGDGR